ncbi:MBL fold metallo-hydrolase [Nocardia terpenica]|uniref:MBL fold metallo-hydrolase n=1 Tax=Nocardia terpenica TaxID=455432 RepID=A0A6G9Z959_9NOCA|nr:MBL fold metallo-hydrolase [Nocardia terpenica]QIS22022.1 MBL fold metallo-hydrolase [Nocardia terpenica]
MCIACSGMLAMATGSTSPDVFPAEAPQPGWLGTAPVGATITWTGCAGFIFAAGNTRIAFDPFVSNPGLIATLLRPAKPDSARIRRTFTGVSAAFVGHSHYDHAMDVAEIARATPETVIHGSETTAELCRRQGVSDNQLKVVADGDRVTVGPFTIEAVASRHGVVPLVSRFEPAGMPPKGMPRSPIRWPKGDVFAYRLEFAGLTIHLHTSAGFDNNAFARQQPADIVIPCLAARAATPRYFERLGEQLRPKILIPCHHDNFLRPLDTPPKPVPQLDWPGFLADIDKLNNAYGTKLVQLPRGVAVPF